MAKKSTRKTARKPAKKTGKRPAAKAAKKKAARKPATPARKSSPRKSGPKKTARTARAKKAPARQSSTKTPTAKASGVSDAAVKEATGKGWSHWLTVLDAFDVKTNGHKAAAEHLHAKHGVGDWWAQMVTVGYEQKRGLRLLRQKADGFSASASRTISVAISRVMDAFEDKGLAERWLPPGVVAHKVSRPPMKGGRPTKPGSARMTWTDGSKTLSVWISDKSGKDGAAKTAVQVQHDKLPDAETCDRMRAMWSERMDALRGMLEAQL